MVSSLELDGERQMAVGAGYCPGGGSKGTQQGECYFSVWFHAG